MITYNEVLQIARSKMSRVNRCDEDDLAYLFSYDTVELMIGRQGNLGGVKCR